MTIPSLETRRLLLRPLKLEDADRKSEAIEAYEEALRTDPLLSDCHYNVALLYEEQKKPRDAIRHMSQYRRLRKK